MNFIERWFAQMGITKLFDAIDGYKTYSLAGLGVVIALVGHFWGPVTLPGPFGTIPKESWNDVWSAVNASGLIAFLRHAISKATPPAGAAQ